MVNSTDISKLYNLMDEDPGKYKEMMNNEHQVRQAMRNWPLVRAMALPSFEIPPVLVGENFDMGTTVKQIDNPVNEQIIKNTTPTKVNKKRVAVHADTMADATSFTAVPSAFDVENEMQVSKPISSIQKLKSVVASEVIDTVSASKALNIVDLSKRNVRATVNPPTQDKPFREGRKLASLFSRLEEGHRSDEKNVNILKLRRS